MCTYQTENLAVRGSGKDLRAGSRFPASRSISITRRTIQPSTASTSTSSTSAEAPRRESRSSSTRSRHGSWHGRSWTCFRPRLSIDSAVRPDPGTTGHSVLAVDVYAAELLETKPFVHAAGPAGGCRDRDAMTRSTDGQGRGAQHYEQSGLRTRRSCSAVSGTSRSPVPVPTERSGLKVPWKSEPPVATRSCRFAIATSPARSSGE